MMAVDLTNFRKISYKDEVILWGKGHEVDIVAKYANNSSYTLMTGIKNRVKKVYLT